MDEQTLTGSGAQGPQAPGRRVARPVDFGRILHRQHHRDVLQAAVGRLDMAVQDVLRLDGVVGKEAIGGFEHGAIATGFGQGGGGMLGQDTSEFDQARGAPHIAEFGIGKLADGPVVYHRLGYACPTPVSSGCSWGCWKASRAQHTPRASKIKIVGNWQLTR